MLKLIGELKEKERIGLAVALSLLLLAVVDRSLIAPFGAKIGKLEKEIQASEKQLAKYLRYLNRREDIEKEYEKYAGYVEKTGTSEEEAAKMLSEIEAIARRTGVYIAAMKPLPPRSLDFYRRYAVDVEIEGCIFSLMDFLHGLSLSDQLLRAEEVNLSLEERNSGTIKSPMIITKVLVP